MLIASSLLEASAAHTLTAFSSSLFIYLSGILQEARDVCEISLHTTTHVPIFIAINSVATRISTSTHKDIILLLRRAITQFTFFLLNNDYLHLSTNIIFP